ncbi:serine/threonine-protein kinase [Populibacterium corticicola]|uniref:Serine/threonine-protein kinase n=1 Tax=Populibacterium corticicola TaxID=1812826 RepID=A0ABW5XJ96_9MICO
MGFEPGTEIGGYRIVNQLGAGAMGVVYRAVDGGGQAVAFKILRSSAIDQDELRERLIREATSLRKVNHPAVAAMLDVETDADETFIVTELVEGPTLEAYVADNGPLPPGQLAATAQRLHSALEAVHEAGVVHRDLKPNNVLMGTDGPVLIDFGIAHGMQDPRLTATGLVVGTPGYLAPELINGRHPNAGTDLWGWAAVLTFAATGRAPFGYGGYEAVIARAMAGKPDVDGLDERVAYALRGALAVSPENRWSPQDVIEELKDAAAMPGTVPIYHSATDSQATEVITATPPVPLPDADPTLVRPQATVPLEGNQLVGNQDGHTAVISAEDSATEVLERGTPPTFTPIGAGAGEHETFDESQGISYPSFDSGDGEGYPEDDYQRAEPRHRWVPLSAAALTVVLAACWAPFITIIVLVGFLLLFSVVGIGWDAYHGKRERRGPRQSDTAAAVFLAPWHAIKGIAYALPSLVFSGVVSIFVGGSLFWLAYSGNLGGSPQDGEIARGHQTIIIAAAVTVFVILAWFGPLTRTTRLGGRLTMEALFPGPFATMVLVFLLLGASAYIAFVVYGETALQPWPFRISPESANNILGRFFN